MSLRTLCFVLVVTTFSPSTVISSASDGITCDPDVLSRYILAMDESRFEGLGSGLVCKEGEYLDWYKCSPCEEGTFRTRLMASSDRLSMCHNCLDPGM
ncbi:hypothetical protein Bpfe_030431, partial [Biomphalaria pfeifferi]